MKVGTKSYSVVKRSFCMLAITSICIAIFTGGCATTGLWESGYVTNMEKKVEMLSDQVFIYLPSDTNQDKINDKEMYCVKFTLPDGKADGGSTLGGNRSGYLIFTESSSWKKNLPPEYGTKRKLFLDPDVKVEGVLTYNIKESWYLEILISINKERPDIFQMFHLEGWDGKSTNHMDGLYMKPVSNTVSNGRYYYTILAPILRNKEFSELNYHRVIEPSDWLPMLPVGEKKYSFIMYPEYKRKYRFNLTERIMLTPLAVAADIVTSPYQLFVFTLIATGNGPR